MAYQIYLGKTLLPVAPGKLEMKINNQNQTVNLINDGEINIFKKAGLTEVSFTALLPNVDYPFASYKGGFEPAKRFLDELEKLKVEQKPFQFIVIREMLRNGGLYGTNIKMGLEEYSIIEDAKEGFDVVVQVKLKQYKAYGTKVAKVVETTAIPQVTIEPVRAAETSPAPANPQTYTVNKGDCLWNIAKKYYGDGSKYPDIQAANGDKIKNPNLIYPGQVLTIPAL